MVQLLHRANPRSTALWAAGALVAFLGLIASYAASVMGGTKTGTALAFLAAVGPILVGAAIVAPFVFPFGLYAFVTPLDPILIVTSAATLARVLGAISAVALLFYAVRNRRFADPDKSLVPWILYFLWLAASGFWAMDTTRTFQMLPTALSLFGLYVAVALVRIDFKTLKLVAGLALAGGLVAAVYLIHIHNTGVGLHEGRTFLKTDSVYWNPDFLGGALILPVGLATTLALSDARWILRAAAAISILIMLPALVFTGARGPEMAVAIMFAYFLIRERKRVQLACILGAMVLATLAYNGSLITSRWSDALSSGGAGRTDIWSVGLLAFKQNWLFGAGYNNFPAAYDKAFIEVYQPFYAEWHRDPHNMLLQAAVELGIIGLALLLGAWWAQFRVMRNIGKDDARYPLRICLEASLIGLFISAMFVDMMDTKTAWLVFMLVIMLRNAGPARAPAPAVAGAQRIEPVHA